MSVLLQVLGMGSISKKGASPLMMEFQVEADAAPFLVSSTDSLVWVPKASKGSAVRAAVRRGVAHQGAFFMEVVDEVARQGIESDWGNVRPLTPEGVQEAIEHLRFYGLDELDALVPAESRAALVIMKQVQGVHVVPCPWLVGDQVVLVPSDRSFVGFVGYLDHKTVVSVVHNPSRGIAIARSPVVDPRAEESVAG